MALLDPHQPENHRSEGVHPAICLAAGFGVITLAAIAVHVIMQAIL